MYVDAMVSSLEGLPPVGTSHWVSARKQRSRGRRIERVATVSGSDGTSLLYAVCSSNVSLLGYTAPADGHNIGLPAGQNGVTAIWPSAVEKKMTARPNNPTAIIFFTYAV